MAHPGWWIYFPCIYDGRVGIGRTYAKLDGELSYAAWLDSLKLGHEDVRLTAPGTVKARVKAAAYLAVNPNEDIRKRPYDQKPYWDVERARVGDTREVPCPGLTPVRRGPNLEKIYNGKRLHSALDYQPYRHRTGLPPGGG